MTDSYKYMLGISVILAASGFYFFLKNHVGKNGAVFGTLVYILSPYFAVDLYVRGAPGELFIFALFPWSAFFYFKYLKNGGFINLAFSSILIFLIGISHNVLLPFMFGLLFLYGFANLIAFKKLKSFFKLFLPFLLGIGLASYYLIPAFLEVKYIASYEQINLADHFPFLKQLITPHWGYGPSIWGVLDDVSFDIGTVNILLLIASFFLFRFAKRETKVLLVFSWIIFAIALVLTNIRTIAFWESVRFLRLVQFPWRMLLLTTISTAFIAGVSTDIISEKYKKQSPYILGVIFILLIGLNIWHYHPSEKKQISDERYLELYFADQTLNGERETISQDYFNFTEDFIPPTIWQSKRPTEILPKVFFASDSGKIDFTQSGLGYEINYEAMGDNKLVIRRAYFPGWEAETNSSKISGEPYSELGLTAFPVSSGSGTLKAQFKNTQVRTIANLVSAIALGVILVLLIYPFFKKKR